MNYNFLKEITLFANLDNNELSLVETKLKKVKFKAGETIFLEDSAGNELYILYSGDVSISKKMTLLEDDGIEKTLLTLSGDSHPFFGEVGLLGKQLRTASAIARTDCELLTINHKDFTSILKDYPNIGSNILMQIALKLASILEKTDSDILKLTTALIYALK